MEEDEEVRDDMAGQTNKNKRELKIQLTEENKRSCGFWEGLMRKKKKKKMGERDI